MLFRIEENGLDLLEEGLSVGIVLGEEVFGLRMEEGDLDSGELGFGEGEIESLFGHIIISS